MRHERTTSTQGVENERRSSRTLSLVGIVVAFWLGAAAPGGASPIWPTAATPVPGLVEPTLSISDTSVSEGDSGEVLATFTVTLSAPSTQVTGSNYSICTTQWGTADFGTDWYGPFSTVVFQPGETVRTFSVHVIGDTIDEGDETFFVQLDGPFGATIDRAIGMGTIVDDDFTLQPAVLVVDLHGGTGLTGNGNGVLEPGETVQVEPSWHNGGSESTTVSGTGSAFSGPAGATYSLGDPTAAYGMLAPGSTAGCYAASGNCLAVAVSAPATRPATHWDATLDETLSPKGAKTWMIHIGSSFTDVSASNAMYRYVETLLHTGVTAGCGATSYCPTGTVSRAQMATFVARAMAGSDAAVPASGTVPGKGSYSCTSGGTSLFADVDATVSYCRHVHYVYAAGVSQGCTASTFCPSNLVSRAQMAMFVARAMAGSDAAVPTSYSDPASGRSYDCGMVPNLHFADITSSMSYCRHTHYLWARQVADGCTAGTYCPTSTVNRGAMAKFVTNGFGLHLYGP
jgi:hypothetical protein